MNRQSIHRRYRHFRELPPTMRTLFTGTLALLGLGYLFAAIYVFAAHSGADGRTGLSVEDIKITYGGSAEVTPMEQALRGPMSGMLPARDLESVLEWIEEGARKRDFEARIEVIFEESCLSCHDGSNPHLSNLDGYDNVALLVAHDTGADLYTLVRVSHIHFFGLTFVFFIVGFIFSHAYVRPVWLKHLVIALPFLGVILDVLGWYVTKVFSPFAWVVLVAGFINGLAFAFMWVVSIYQMWIYRVPDELASRNGDQG